MKAIDYLSLLSRPLGEEADILRRKIQFVIRDMGLNILSASKKMGLDSFVILNDFYKKDQIPDFAFFKQFCSTFGVSEDWLYDLEDTGHFIPFEPSLINNGEEVANCQNAIVNIIIRENDVIVVSDKYGEVKYINRVLEFDSQSVDKNINLLLSIIQVSRKVNLCMLNGRFPFVPQLAQHSPGAYVFLSSNFTQYLPCDGHLVIQNIKEAFEPFFRANIDKALTKRLAGSNGCNNKKKEDEAQIEIHGLYIEEL
jgi:hypothetical protein